MASTLSKISLFSEIENSPDKLARAEMKSSASTEAGLGVNHTAPADNTNWSFDPVSGFDPAGSDAVKYDVSQFLTAGQITSLRTEGRINLSLSSGFNSDDNASLKYIISTNGSVGGWIEYSASGNFQNRFFGDFGTTTGVKGGAIKLSSLTTDLGSNVVTYWSGAHGRTFWNGLLVDQVPAVVFDTDFVDIFVGGLTTANSDYLGEGISDFQLSAHAPILQENKYRILHLGDSLTAQGGPDSQFVTPAEASVRLPWVATNTTLGGGFDSDGTTPFQGDLSWDDVGCIASFYRTLGQSNIYPFDDNRNVSYGGADVADMVTKVSGLSGWVPTDVVCSIGTNDIQSTTNVSFETSYHNLIKGCWELGAQRFYAVQIPTAENYSIFQNDPDRTSRADKNAIIAGLPAWALANGYGDFVSYVPLPSSISSDTAYDSSLFKAGDDLHVNKAGTKLLGETWGAAVVSGISETTSGTGEQSIISHNIIKH